MNFRLHSTCQLADGYHWLVIKPNGMILAESMVGFPTLEMALIDLGIQKRER